MPDSAYTHVYVGPNRELHGMRCRVVAEGVWKGEDRVMIEFQTGGRTTCPVRCIRKRKEKR